MILLRNIEIRVIALGAVVLSNLGCPPSAKAEPEAELRRAVLTSVSGDVVLPSLERFNTAAQDLQRATSALATARAIGPGTTELQAAQAAFATAFLSWQLLEPMQFGPAGAPGATTNGLGLRDFIYSWPTINTCRIDANLVDEIYARQSFFDSALVTSTGLVAIEHLLFSNERSNSCPTSATLNTTGAWSQLSFEVIQARRAAYAAAASAALVTRGEALRDAWTTTGFLAKFQSAGNKSSGYPSAQAAVDEVFAALFYADKTLKDAKLGGPAALTNDCQAASCPELAEARLSRLSREAAVANLDGVAAIFRGSLRGDGQGLDRLLAARGAQDISVEFLAAVARARQAVSELEAPIDESVSARLASVQAAHAAVKIVTDFMKSHLVTALSLKIPQEAAGDSD
jgi:predicted lipoprotein